MCDTHNDCPTCSYHSPCPEGRRGDDRADPEPYDPPHDAPPSDKLQAALLRSGVSTFELWFQLESDAVAAALRLIDAGGSALDVVHLFLASTLVTDFPRLAHLAPARTEPPAAAYGPAPTPEA